MRSPRLSRFALIAAMAVVGCGGSTATGTDNGNNNNNNNNNGSCGTKYTATINGSAWCALSTVANYYANQQQVVITGTGLIGAGGWSVTLSTSAITTTGTYNLTTVSPLRFAIVGGSNGIGYSTTNAGGTGTITFTTFTTTHVVGTYSFTAPANTGNSGTATVTNGTFDVALTPGN